MELRVAQVLEQGNLHRVLVLVSEGTPTGADVPLTLSVGARTSDALGVTVEASN
jgi:hypothetical protein